MRFTFEDRSYAYGQRIAPPGGESPDWFGRFLRAAQQAAAGRPIVVRLAMGSGAYNGELLAVTATNWIVIDEAGNRAFETEVDAAKVRWVELRGRPDAPIDHSDEIGRT